MYLAETRPGPLTVHVRPYQKPGHFATSTSLARLVRQVLDLNSNLCEAYANEVMKDPHWRRKVHPGVELKRLTSTQTEQRTAMLKRLRDHVVQELEKGGSLRAMKGVVWETLVYALGLHADRSIIKTVMARFQKEDDHFEPKVRC